MAFISHQHKFIYLHPTKCAGTSIKIALADAHGVQIGDLHHMLHDGIDRRLPAEFMPDDIQDHDDWLTVVTKHPETRDYTVLVSIRDPWSRLFSLWQHKRRRGDDDVLGYPVFKDCMRRSRALLDKPISWWLPDDPGVRVLAMDCDDLTHDFTEACLLLGLPETPLGCFNTSAAAHHRVHYDANAQRLVEHYYHEDIQRFEFEFGGCD